MSKKSDTCHYCGVYFHPMMIWTNQTDFRFVCQFTIETDDDGFITKFENGSKCEQKAKDDGYTKRSDLTPRR